MGNDLTTTQSLGPTKQKEKQKEQDAKDYRDLQRLLPSGHVGMTCFVFRPSNGSEHTYKTDGQDIWTDSPPPRGWIINQPLCKFGIGLLEERTVLAAKTEMFDRLGDTLLRCRNVIAVVEPWIVIDVTWIVAAYAVEIEPVHFNMET